MLPSGPRSPYSLPPIPHATVDVVARELIATIRDQEARSNGVRTGMLTTGCDGNPVINPLDGTSCNGDGGQVGLFNPQTRRWLATIGRPAAGLTKTSRTVPAASCSDVIAALRRRRRFRDNLGNEYGPDGEWLSHSNPPAQLETEYVHRILAPRFWSRNGLYGEDLYPPIVTLAPQVGMPATVFLEKRTGAVASAPIYAPWTYSPLFDDVTTPIPGVLFHSSDDHAPVTPVLEDVSFGGAYTGGPGRHVVEVTIHSTGTPDTFNWIAYSEFGAGSSGSAVPITGTPQTLFYGISVTFASTTGHSTVRTFPSAVTAPCSWVCSIEENNDFYRTGVGVRGALEEAVPCVNGGFPNRHILVTNEDDIGSAHAIVVRDAESLAELYRHTGHTGISEPGFFTSQEKWSWSSNGEGLFFAHSYIVAADKRKVAVISVDPLTFEPTIAEIITLESNSHTGSYYSFANALTI